MSCDLFKFCEISINISLRTQDSLSVCFSVQCLKNRCSSDHQTWHRNVPPWILETHLFLGQKVKDTRHEKQFRRGFLQHLSTLLSAGVLFGSKLGFSWYWIHFTVRFGSVHAIGYNFAESEPIWMKFGALWVHCQGLAPADFGRDLSSSDNWRARRNFLSGKQRTISPIFRRPNFTKFEHNTSIDEARKTFRTEFLKFYCKRSFFQKQHKILRKFLTSCDFRPP